MWNYVIESISFWSLLTWWPSTDLNISVFSEKAANTYFIVFVLTRSGLEPKSYHTRDEHVKLLWKIGDDTCAKCSGFIWYQMKNEIWYTKLSDQFRNNNGNSRSSGNIPPTCSTHRDDLSFSRRGTGSTTEGLNLVYGHIPHHQKIDIDPETAIDNVVSKEYT